MLALHFVVKQLGYLLQALSVILLLTGANVLHCLKICLVITLFLSTYMHKMHVIDFLQNRGISIARQTRSSASNWYLSTRKHLINL